MEFKTSVASLKICDKILKSSLYGRHSLIQVDYNHQRDGRIQRKSPQTDWTFRLKGFSRNPSVTWFIRNTKKTKTIKRRKQFINSAPTKRVECNNKIHSSQPAHKKWWLFKAFRLLCKMQMCNLVFMEMLQTMHELK